MRLIYVALAAAAIAALTFMLLWAQSESEKAQLLNKYDMMRDIARQQPTPAPIKNESAPPSKHTSGEYTDSDAIESSPSQIELNAKPMPAPASQPTPQLQMQTPPLPANLQPENIKKLQDIQQRLLGLMATGKAANIDEVAKLLAELQGMEQSGVNFQGMDFSIAQKNLEVAKQLQTVSEEIQALSKHSPVDGKKLNAALDRLNKLQAQIKSPVVVIPPH
ncbi:MAG: hypothetical protein PSV18_05125 [Methylobacter sp.]|uniref:Uncharacterized protein n=1 Tax=Candidatus Methylobacter titanis TaxID=3053457 RepID=A0AA43TK44_9GAMM|nr:hypothetical protein [Candidatus Methylobacter titanis]MDI1292111.1 hypothetical protein [Candidatus Methylobacter titanis]